MDTRYHSATNMPQHYDLLSNITNNNNNNTNNTNGNSTSANTIKPTTPLSSRYFHRAPLIFPRYQQHQQQQQQQQQQHQQRFPNPSPRYSSAYSGPLHTNRPHFSSAWELNPRPTIYNSSQNIASTAPISTPIPKQHNEGSFIT